MTNTTAAKTRTITLTGRPPVKIREDEWPTLAEASYHDYDTQYDFQSHRHWRGWVRVRQHEDGRALVYAACSHSTQFPTERDYEQRAGELLGTDATTAQIIEAIRRVHASINIVDQAHRDMWRLLVDECIADLPAEEL